MIHPLSRIFPKRIAGCLLAVLVAAFALRPAESFGQSGSDRSVAQAAQPATVRCAMIEFYVRSDQPGIAEAVEALRASVATKRGVRLRVYDLVRQPEAEGRFASIAKAYRLSGNPLPMLYGLNHAIAPPRSSEQLTPAQWVKGLDDLLRIEIFTRVGCPRCVKAKEALPAFFRKYPGLIADIRDVTTDATASDRFQSLARSQGVGGVSFPGFWLCHQLLVGFDASANSMARLEGILKRWTFDCPAQPPLGFHRPDRSPTSYRFVSAIRPGQELSNDALPLPPDPSAPPDPVPALEPSPTSSSEGSEPGFAIDEFPSDSFPIDLEPLPELPTGGIDGDEDEQAIDLPWFGRISATRLGLPLFTILIGLVDGFNPCAMWVLLFLLSVLVNLQDRWKIFAVAGTFVAISGIAYFLFMAAWLNVFLWIGFLRWVQVILAMLAIFVGCVHIKDYFALHQGLSLSIPESAKPGIYARVRRIVMAESLWGAIIGASVLAVLVNLVELLCTAGLPALYTQVLALREYPAWKNYAYLGLYILAYMFDDAVMVGIVVITLGKRRLQEREGRWLKLASGLVVLALGLVLLLRPDWLVY